LKGFGFAEGLDILRGKDVELFRGEETAYLSISELPENSSGPNKGQSSKTAMAIYTASAADLAEPFRGGPR